MRRSLLKLAIGALLGAGLAAATPARAQQAGFVLMPNAPKLALYSDVGPNFVPPTGDQIFAHPVTDPYFHEDSFNSTDVRIWYVYHGFSSHSILDGGEAQVVAAQLRVALTDQLQLVAYKDGFTLLHPGLFKADGWNDLAAGLKWEFLQDNRDQMYSAIGVGYQFPTGYSKVLQNKEEVRLWGSFDKGFDKLHLGATFNYFIATGEEGLYGTGDHLSGHVHADYRCCDFFSPIFEGNVYHVTRSHNSVLPIQGADVANLGDGAADDVWTVAVGAEVRPCDHFALRGAWEKNVSHPSDLFDYRVTVSAVISF